MHASSGTHAFCITIINQIVGRIAYGQCCGGYYSRKFWEWFSRNGSWCNLDGARVVRFCVTDNSDNWVIGHVWFPSFPAVHVYVRGSTNNARVNTDMPHRILSMQLVEQLTDLDDE